MSVGVSHVELRSTLAAMASCFAAAFVLCFLWRFFFSKRNLPQKTKKHEKIGDSTQ
jgi:hypothetical protein